METALLFSKGILAGLAIAAPVGPVGILCVQRTLAHGRAAGLLSGLGAALADALYGCIAAFSLTLVSAWLQAHEQAFKIVGGVLLLFLGGRMLLRARRPSGDMGRADQAPQSRHRLGEFSSTFFLTATNPITIVAFLGIFAFFDASVSLRDLGMAFALVLGVFSGSAIWWLAIAFAAERFGRQLQAGGLNWVARCSGSLLLCFGVYGIASLWL